MHLQNTQLAHKDKEIGVLKKLNSKYYQDWNALAEVYKNLLREVQDLHNYKTRGAQFGPNRDVF